MGNSAVVKLGDGVDWVLMQAAKTREFEFLEQEADYPETIRSILRAYIKVWKPPSGAIPSRRQKKKFDQWVSEFDLLNQIVPVHHEEIFTIALELYNGGNSFIVSHPLALKSLLETAASIYNREHDLPIKDAEPTVDKEEIEKLASPEEVKAVVKKLKSILED